MRRQARPSRTWMWCRYFRSLLLGERTRLPSLYVNCFCHYGLPSLYVNCYFHYGNLLLDERTLLPSLYVNCYCHFRNLLQGEMTLLHSLYVNCHARSLLLGERTLMRSLYVNCYCHPAPQLVINIYIYTIVYIVR